MSFKYSIYSIDHPNDIGSILCMLEERIEALRKSKIEDNAALTEFYRRCLDYAPLRAVLEFDHTRLEDRDVDFNDPPEKRKPDVKKGLARSLPRILESYNWILGDLKKHRLVGLRGVIASIAEKTKSPEIRAASQQWLQEMR